MRYGRAQATYDALPSDIKDNLYLALTWALETLRNHEGAGHSFELSYDPGYSGQEGFIASFCKPQWNADHSSRPMATAQEAVVMAVCEYLNGV